MEKVTFLLTHSNLLSFIHRLFFSLFHFIFSSYLVLISKETNLFNMTDMSPHISLFTQLRKNIRAFQNISNDNIHYMVNISCRY